MHTTTRIDVDLADRSYPIYVGQNLVEHIPGWMSEQLPRTQHALLVSDAAVAHIANPVEQQLADAGFRTCHTRIPSGEQSKCVRELEQLWQHMLGAHTDRGSVLVAVGGGVVGDLAGFAAASFARGIPLVQIPTTLLSQVDSSVGGKTGINLPGAKNIVSAFWQPSLVVIDTDSLNSLPLREYTSGLAEVVKYGVIVLPELFAYLQQHQQATLAKDPASLTRIIEDSCRAKAMVVQEDERETSGRRAILNYGHTFAHAIESTAGYGTFLHGEAVAIGMHMAALLAERLGRVNAQFVAAQQQLLAELMLPTHFADADGEAMWAVMQHDKKVTHGQLRFVLPSRLGHVELVDGVSKTDALAAIADAA